MSKTATIIVTLVAYAISLAVLSVLLLFDAFVLMKVWNWLLVPALGAPHANLAAGLGVSLVFTIATFQPDKDELNGEQLLRVLRKGLTTSLYALWLAWLVSLFL